MPGDRLDQEERRVIAAGLERGLGYAEIARQLARPTSTVSREIARNGGPHGYRADSAHRATQRRAHRRPAPPAGSAAGRPPAAVRAFEAQFAELIVQRGVQRMGARVLAALYVTDSGSCTAGELAAHLGVSPASISKAVGYLEPLGLITRLREQRRERYVVDDAAMMRTWDESLRINALWEQAAGRGAELLGTTTPAGERLAEVAAFFAFTNEVMAGVTHRWPEVVARRRAGES